MVSLIDGDLDKLTLDIVIEVAKMGDSYAISALGTAGKYIGVALSYVTNILNPERIIIGGSLSQAGSFIFDPLLEMAQNLSMPECIDGVSIVPSALGENAGMIGAASMVIQEYLEGAWAEVHKFAK